MRTASDVLTNPKPGDVVRCETQWQPSLFEVSEISDRCVVAVVDGMSCKFEYKLSQWREWFRGAEVVHVAE
jgi:hypothetical protein